ncbi:hypothetical protein GYA19_05695 [Candidatus Beckwithbacteria bacterium]|nr:hypothetical protein [Candidatus Beckwithbacteria bacterium]
MAGQEVESRINLEEKAQLERLRGLIQYDHLPIYMRVILETLLPPDFDIKPFDPASILESEPTFLDERDRKIRRDLMGKLGFMSPSRKGTLDSRDIPHLGVAMSEDNATLAGALFNSPDLFRLFAVGQVEPLASFENIEQGKHPVDSRGQHSFNMAYFAAKTNFRLALLNPDLYKKRVAKDIEVLRKAFGLADHVGFKISSQTLDLINEYKDNLSGSQYLALAYAYEYSKLIILYAVLHDFETPAYGDIVMRAETVAYSEDERLVQSIDYILQGRYLSQVLEKFDVPKELLLAYVKSLASECSPTLLGYLMKDKRRFNQTVLDNIPHLRELKDKSGFDHDQISGTMLNLVRLADSLLPQKTVQGREGAKLKMPIGSLDERLRFLFYAQAMGWTRDEVIAQCFKAGVDRERLYINADEILVGYDLTLREIDFDGNSEIMLVCVKPGSLKRALTAFYLLTLLDYQGPFRAPVERLVKDLINKGIESEEVNLDLFLSRDDNSASLQLRKLGLGVIPHVLENFLDKGKIYTKGELDSQIDSNTTTSDSLAKKIFLYRKLKSGEVLAQFNPKYGSITQRDDGSVGFIGDILRLQRGTDEISDKSLSARFDRLIETMKQHGEDFYYVIVFSQKDYQSLLEALSATKGKYFVEQVFREWELVA